VHLLAHSLRLSRSRKLDAYRPSHRERANNQRKRHSEDRRRRSTVPVVLVTADSQWHVRTIAPPGLKARSHMRARDRAKNPPFGCDYSRSSIRARNRCSPRERARRKYKGERSVPPASTVPLPRLVRSLVSLAHPLSLSLSILLFLTPAPFPSHSLSCWRSLETLGDSATCTSSVSGHRVSVDNRLRVPGTARENEARHEHARAREKRAIHE